MIDDDTACLGLSCSASSCSTSGALQFVAGTACNASGLCNQGGGVTACNDANVCTDHTCDNTTGCGIINNGFSESCYDGPAATKNIGECKDGARTCSGGGFGGCVGQVQPAAEACGDGKDNDCDTAVDEEGAVGCSTFFLDVDNDGYGVTGDTKCLCAATGVYRASQGGDCADGDNTVNPSKTEACNGKDDNCNNVTDEENATGCTVYYKDVDNDGYGLTADSRCLCASVDPYDATANGECNDAEPTTNPGAVERCDAVDNDCDNGTPGGGIDEDFAVNQPCDGADADSCLEGTFVCNVAGTGVDCTRDGVVVALTGEKVDGATVVNQARPGLNGTFTGSITTTADSKFGGAAYDTSGGGHILMDHNSDLNFQSTGGTVAFHIKSNATPSGSRAVPVSKGFGSTRQFEVRVFGDGVSAANQNRARMMFKISGSSFWCSNAALVTPGAGWTHLAATITPDPSNNQTTLAIYQDGALLKSCTYTGLPLDNSSKKLQIGRTSTADSSVFNGAVDDVVIANYPMTGAEVLALSGASVNPGSLNHELCDGADNDCKAGVDDLAAFSDKGNACTEGSGQCANSGTRICHAGGLTTTCSVDGASAGTTCNDGVDCTHTDVCSGGTGSSCGGTTYACSGTCRSCNGTGTCDVGNNTCFIAGCDPADPSCGGASNCQLNGATAASGGDGRCSKCVAGSPGALAGQWSAESGGVECVASSCGGGSWTSAGTCGSGGTAKTCVAGTAQNCNDNNLCTDDNCADAIGCSNVNNSFQRSCYTGAPSELGIGTCAPGIETCTGGGFGACNNEVTPVDELCATNGKDGLDNNCDGLVDNIGDFKTYYTDLDSDNHGDPNGPTVQDCAAPVGMALANDDCDDNDGKNYPNNTEKCDDQDNDCDSSVDENFSDKGDACDGTFDIDLCTEGHKICTLDGNGTTCGDTDGPAGVWDFDFGSATVIKDRSGADHDAVGLNGTTIDPAGKFGRALKFDGSNDNVRQGTWGQFVDDTLTISLWVKPTKLSGNQTLATSSGIGDAQGCCWRWILRIQGDKVVFMHYDGATKKITSLAAVTLNQWNHVAITVETGATAKMYVNCAKETAEVGIANAAPFGYLQFGSVHWTGSPFDVLQGSLDDIAIYKTIKTSAELNTLCTSGVRDLEKNEEVCDGNDNNCRNGQDEDFTNLGSACTVGGDAQCSLTGALQCAVDGLSDTCSVSGKSAGTSCSDSDICSSGDVCSGGDGSTCSGTPYSCSGSCRQCDGLGTCTTASNKCYVPGGCDSEQPGCAGTCFDSADDSAGNQNTHNAQNTSCLYCDPGKNQHVLSNRGVSWACKDGTCNGNASHDPQRFCNGGGSCVNQPDDACNDGNVCTDDSCNAAAGCQTSNNTAVFDSNCYTGTPAATKNVGVCHGGTEFCSGGTGSGTCVGQVTPNAEVCDGQDNDCDGTVDEDVKNTYYRDADGDGYGDPNDSQDACSPPPGYVGNDKDCLDSGTAKSPTDYSGSSVPASQVNPDATEKCDGIDNNCSGGNDAAQIYTSGVDETFADKGTGCDGADADSCTDSFRVCAEDGLSTFCANRMAWGAYGFGGGTTEPDISGFGNHGVDAVGHTTSNLPPLLVPGGHAWPQVLSFNGSNQFLQMSHTTAKPYNLSGPNITVSAWIRWNGQGGSNIIANKESSYEIAVNGGRFQCAIQVDGGGGWFWVDSSPVVANVWTHVACKYAKATCSIDLFVNGGKTGSAVDPGCQNVTASNLPLYLGRRPSGAYFAGQIAAAAVYDVALTAAEIADLSVPNTTPFVSNEANYEWCDGQDNDCKAGADDTHGGKGNSCVKGGGTCANSGTQVCDNNQLGHDPNSTWGQTLLCSATGKGAGTTCNDANACSFSDKCTGGDSSVCGGTSYSCSGSCRQCDSNGGCTVDGATCYIAGCSPSNRNCSGSCFDQNDDPNGVQNSHNSSNTSCRYCHPPNSVNTWSNRSGGGTYACKNGTCVGLTHHPVDFCNGSGTCADSGNSTCDDSNVCTNDSCAGNGGCSNPANSHSESCYEGPTGTDNKGDCAPGTKTCSAGSFGQCVGQVLPKAEVCDGGTPNDEDCDGLFNEQDAGGCTTYFKDADQDTYGVNGDTRCLCAPSFPYTATQGNDCADNNNAANPGQTEKCNGFDDNCNNQTDEQNAQGCTTYFGDDDNDGYGESADSRCYCATTGKYDTTAGGDCVDTNNQIHPNQTELCDGIDNDCEGGIDEDFSNKGQACSKGNGGCQNTGNFVCNAAKNGTLCNVTGKPAGTACADSNNCTHTDKCSGGDSSSCSGTAYSCNDNKGCTTDACTSDSQALCTHTVNNGKCFIGNTCYSHGDRQGGTSHAACKYCSAANKTDWTKAPSTFVCNASKCAGLTFHSTDFCGAGTGQCANAGETACTGNNPCKEYSCHITQGCQNSNLGDGTVCGDGVCSGDTFKRQDLCEGGVCKDKGNADCTTATTLCTTGFCVDGSGCSVNHAGNGTLCGGQDCTGQKYNNKDKCNGAGTCVDGGQVDCNGLDNSCRDGYCVPSGGCNINNFGTTTACTNGHSNKCVGAVWYFQDTCDGVGGCADKGSENCDTKDKACADYYCSGGCLNFNATPKGTVCQASTCKDGCTVNNAVTCNGTGACSDNGGSSACTGNRCSGVNCTSSCGGNLDCCDISGDDRTCIGGTCANRSACGAVCDNADNADCAVSGQVCVDCGAVTCESHNTGRHCYESLARHADCGCQTTNAYGVCTLYKSCHRCP